MKNYQKNFNTFMFDMKEDLDSLTIFKNKNESDEEHYEPEDVADYIEDWKKNRCSD